MPQAILRLLSTKPKVRRELQLRWLPQPIDLQLIEKQRHLILDGQEP